MQNTFIKIIWLTQYNGDNNGNIMGLHIYKSNTGLICVSLLWFVKRVDMSVFGRKALSILFRFRQIQTDQQANLRSVRYSCKVRWVTSSNILGNKSASFFYKQHIPNSHTFTL